MSIITAGYPTPLPMQKLFNLLFIVALLYGCASTPQRPDVSKLPPVEQAEQAMASGEYARAHVLYLQLANEHTPPQSWHYRYRAAEALFLAGFNNQAIQLLEEMPVDELPLDLRMSHQLLQARIHLRRDPDQSLSLLLYPAVDETRLPDRPDLFADYHHLRARAFSRLGNHLESAREGIMREIYLSDSVMIDENQQAIWHSLAMLTPQALRQLRFQPPPDALSGWMELAELARDYGLTPQALQQRISQWRERYPGHPATANFLDTLLLRSAELSTRPANIALLLPLSGRFANAGRAIQDGIIAAWYADPQREQTRLRIIDVGDAPELAIVHYQQALFGGADFVIGPLDKSAVETLALQENLAVPTLALNQTMPPLNDKLYQFGLSPEDEAREVANRAWQSGYQHAGLLIPASPLGERLAYAFRTHWEELGGQVLAENTYQPTHNDFAGPIKGLLNINDSELRYRRINLLSARKVEFIPRRRQDIDFLFLAAQPRQARLIRPQLRFHHAGDVPVLATSHLYSGSLDRDADRDMDGILFCDMPWTLKADTVTRSLRESQGKLLASHTDQLQRFVAMGVDAYQLVPLLGMLKSHPHEYYPGETGRLSVTQNGQIHRELEWARFERGSPQLLSDEVMEDPHVRTLTH